MTKKTKVKGKKDKGNAKWCCDDEATLLKNLKRTRGEGKWGDNDPKPAAWNECITALLGSEIRTGGIAKNVSALKSRWQHVRDYCIGLIHTNTSFSS